jgi:hypothetical protein
MQQLTLPMLTVYEGPELVDDDLVRQCASYREAVVLCWQQRKRRNMTQRLLAEATGLYPSHVSDYLSGRPDRRALPGEFIDPVERACGNRAITQWHLLQVQRTEDEVEAQLEAQRRAA